METNDDARQRVADSISYMTYSSVVRNEEKPLIWMASEIKTPPFSADVRPMPSIGRHCYELRVATQDRIGESSNERVDEDAIVIVEVFAKKSSTPPKRAIETCRARLKASDGLIRGE